MGDPSAPCLATHHVLYVLMGSDFRTGSSWEKLALTEPRSGIVRMSLSLCDADQNSEFKLQVSFP